MSRAPEAPKVNYADDVPCIGLMCRNRGYYGADFMKPLEMWCAACAPADFLPLESRWA